MNVSLRIWMLYLTRVTDDYSESQKEILSVKFRPISKPLPEGKSNLTRALEAVSCRGQAVFPTLFAALRFSPDHHYEA